MKKFALFGFLLVVLVVSAHASVYDHITQIQANPGNYIAVISSTASIDEVKAASELVGFLGIKKSMFDTQVSTDSNLVIVGINNQKIGKEVKGVLVESSDTNLIVAGSSLSNLRQAIQTVKTYEQNADTLSDDVVASSNFFSPITDFLSKTYMYIIGVLVLGGVAFMVVHHKGPLHTPVKKIIHGPAYDQLRAYVSANLQKGYTTEQIQGALLKIGWNQGMVDDVFREVMHANRGQS